MLDMARQQQIFDQIADQQRAHAVIGKCAPTSRCRTERRGRADARTGRGVMRCAPAAAASHKARRSGRQSPARRQASAGKKSAGTTAKGASLVEAHDQPGIDHTEQAFAHDHARGHQHAQPLGALAVYAAIVNPADHGAHHHREGDLHGKINPEAHRQRRNAQPACAMRRSRPAARCRRRSQRRSRSGSS